MRSPSSSLFSPRPPIYALHGRRSARYCACVYAILARSASLFRLRCMMICSCEEHKVGEYRQVQREGLKMPKSRRLPGSVRAPPLPQLSRPRRNFSRPTWRRTMISNMAKRQYLTSPPKISTMPPGVPYIVGNEAAERFSYYGMNSILTIFMTKYLMDKMGHLSLMQPAPGRSVVSHFCFRSLFSSDFRRDSGRCCLWKILGGFWSVDCLLRRARHPGPDGHGRRPRDRAAILARCRAAVDRDWRRRNKTVRFDQRGRSVRRNEQASPDPRFQLVLFFDQRRFGLFDLADSLAAGAVSAAPAGSIAKLPPSVVGFLESPRLHSPDIAFGLPGIFMAIATLVSGWVARSLSIFRRSGCGLTRAKSLTGKPAKFS